LLNQHSADEVGGGDRSRKGHAWENFCFLLASGGLGAAKVETVELLGFLLSWPMAFFAASVIALVLMVAVIVMAMIG
jgi:hypothetical protein